METRGNKRQRGKKVLTAVLALMMLLASAVTAMAAETVVFTGETNGGETLELMTISGVLGRPEESYKLANGLAYPTYICASDFTVEFSEACSTKFCRIIGLEWKEAKQDPDTMTFIEEGYNNNGKNYKLSGNKFINPNDGTEAFQFNASVVNDENVSQISVARSTILIVVNDNYAASTEETAEPENEAPTEEQTKAANEPVMAKYTDSRVMIDGKTVEFEAYNINDNNYFKLRDLAMALNGTKASFSVEWFEEDNSISIERGDYTGGVCAAYVPVGGELQKGDGTDKMAYVSTQTVAAPMDGGTVRAYNNGEVVGWAAYNINNNNYFKLRDIGELFEFEVDWDGENNCVIIDTTKPYTVD